MQKSMHHSFDIHIAETYGIGEAILIHHFQHWITINQRLKRNNIEGHTWSYQSLEEIVAHFPYWSKSEVFNLLERLCNGKGRRSKKEGFDFDPVLKKGSFNKSKYDRTTWYCFVDEPKWILAQAKIMNGSSQNQDCPEPTPIPDAIPDTKSIVSTNVDTAREAHVSFGKFVKLNEKEYQTLCEANSKELVDSKIEEINDYLSSTGRKPYKDYAATLRNWIRRAIAKNPGRKSSETKDANLSTFKTIAAHLKSLNRFIPFHIRKDGVYHKDGDSISLDLQCSEFENILCGWAKLRKD